MDQMRGGLAEGRALAVRKAQCPAAMVVGLDKEVDSIPRDVADIQAKVGFAGRTLAAGEAHCPATVADSDTGLGAPLDIDHTRAQKKDHWDRPWHNNLHRN